jgi:hypothetical protein
VWLETRGNQVFFSKNYAIEKAGRLATIALSTREEKRLAIVNRVATLPKDVH